MTRWNVRLTVASALLYTLAFNLTFFIQELFLVLPKAFTPGLRPTLFHNNHHWEGDSPLVGLFQGTGALATFLTATLCAVLLWRGWGRSRGRGHGWGHGWGRGWAGGWGGSSTARLFLIWMAYNGFFQSLPQVLVGAFVPANDVGMAMDYFGLRSPAKNAAAIAALVAMPLIGYGLALAVLSLAEDRADIASSRARGWFVFRVATLPAVIAIALILPFRVPREWIEVVLVPVVVTVIGIIWIQGSAWVVRDVSSGSGSAARATTATTAAPATPVEPAAPSVAPLVAAVVILLLVFQLVLRPGIRFF